MVPERPVLPVTPDSPVAQEELVEPVLGPGAVEHHVGPGSAQVPHRLLSNGGDPHGGELAGAQQQGQALGVPAVGLHPVRGSHGDERWGHHLAAHPEAAEQAGQLVAGGAACFVAGHQLRGVRESPYPHRRSVRVESPNSVEQSRCRKRDRVAAQTL